MLGVLFVAPFALAGTQLWLYPQDAGPREGGHLIPPGDFVLVIENRGKPTDENKVLGVELIVAANDPASITALSFTKVEDGGTLDLGDWLEGTPELPCSLRPMSRHGVYPATYAKVLLGDLAGGEKVEIDVTVEGGEDLRVHFDAIGTAWKSNRNGEKCSDVSNPSGHDVTVGQQPGNSDDCGRVRISKISDQKFVDIGDVVTFEIGIFNEGLCDLTDPVLTDFVPVIDDGEGGLAPAFSLSSADPMPDSYDELTMEWSLETPMPAGAGGAVTLEVLFQEPLADGQRVVNRACISAAEMRKPRCAAAVVIVGDLFGEYGPAGPGFWCHAARFVLEERHNAPVGAEELAEWLLEIDGDSEVFDELYDASTLEAALDLLCSPQSASGAADRLARHLLTLWLNVVSGRLASDQVLEELCDGDELMPDDVEPVTVMELIVAAEDALILPENEQELNYWSEVVDAVNNSLVRGESGCTAPISPSGRKRAGNGKPAKSLAGMDIGN
jgi:uncharacterized repeat protein (TIGR01451 family)